MKTVDPLVNGIEITCQLFLALGEAILCISKHFLQKIFGWTT